MENIDIFKKHFKKGMIIKDFESFKRTHPTLLKCILEAMNEVKKSVCEHIDHLEVTNELIKCKCGKEFDR